MDELIDDFTSRVPARLPLGCVQPDATPLGVEAPPDGEVEVPVDVPVDAPVDVLDDVGAGEDDDVADVEDDDFFELPPQPASSATTATTKTSAPSIWLRRRRPKTLI